MTDDDYKPSMWIAFEAGMRATRGGAATTNSGLLFEEWWQTRKEIRQRAKPMNFGTPQPRYDEEKRKVILANTINVMRAIMDACPEVPAKTRGIAAALIARGEYVVRWREHSPVNWSLDAKEVVTVPSYKEMQADLNPAIKLVLARAFEADKQMQHALIKQRASMPQHSSHLQACLADASSSMKLGLPPAFGKVVMMTHDEMIVEAPAGRPLVASWTCRGHSCPTRAPVTAERRPACYTCGQLMAAADACGDELLKSYVEFATPKPVPNLAEVSARVSKRVAESMGMPARLLSGVDIARGLDLDAIGLRVGLERGKAEFIDHMTASGVIRECVLGAETDSSFRERILMHVSHQVQLTR